MSDVNTDSSKAHTFIVGLFILIFSMLIYGMYQDYQSIPLYKFCDEVAIKDFNLPEEDVSYLRNDAQGVVCQGTYEFKYSWYDYGQWEASQDE